MATSFLRSCCGLLVILPLLAGAQTTFQSVSGSAKADLDKALTELAELQKKVGAEKIPLTKRLNDAEDALLAARKASEKAQRTRDNQLVELNALKAEVKKQADELGYLTGLLTEFTTQWESRIHITELQLHRPLIAATRQAAESKELEAAQKLEKQLALVAAAVKRMEGLIGGESFEGSALSPAGVLEKGKFTLLGPSVLFASPSGTAGLAVQQLGTLEPTVFAVDPIFSAGIKTLTASGKGELPVDATMGNAQKLAATKETTWQHILKGGPVMWPILGIGVLSVLIALIKWVQIALIRTATPMDMQVILAALRRRDEAKAMEHAKRIRGPAGEMLVAAVEHCREKKEYIEEVLYEKMLNSKPRLERLLPFIALTAATAPLLGLLGTVTGMINTFTLISVFGTGDPKTLSSGISEALITTEYGLIVSIPSLLLHAFMSRKVKGVIGSMESSAVAFINGVPDPEGAASESVTAQATPAAKPVAAS